MGMMPKKQAFGGRRPESLGGASRRSRFHQLAAAGLPALLIPALLSAQDPPSWTRPTDPFPVIGPIHYVGTAGLSSYLIKTKAGAIVLDATLAGNVPAIERNIVRSGVRLRDVKLLLLSHAHFDHAAGLAQLKADTGARLVAGQGDRAALESGIPPGETSYGVIRFPAVRVDRAVRDGEHVRLGEVTLTARATPGHTPGCTTWTMRLVDHGRLLAVVFPCSVTVAGNRLVGNRRYPGIVADFRTSFARLATVRADVVLPAHPEAGQVMERRARRDAGDADAFVDRALLGRIVGDGRRAFDADLAKQQR